MKKHNRKIAALLTLALCVCLGLAAAPAALAANSAPVAENLELMTYRSVSVGGRLTAIDPEGDTLTYAISTEPSKGQVELSADGSFVYTPAEGKKGRDYFGYKATDSQGNISQEATVIIRIQKQKTAVCYSDMVKNGDEFAAVCLAENGLYVGAMVGGQYVFGPEEPVSRGEFLAMCMELSGQELIDGVMSTGFADDGEISAWLKPYVSTALIDGVITGTGEEEAVFSAEDTLTLPEAAVMLDGVLRLTDVSAAGYGEAVPQWAAQSVANLTACDIIDSLALTQAALTRAQAAQMLSRAMSGE